MITKEEIMHYFRNDVLDEMHSKLRRKDYKHACNILNEMYHMADRLEHEMILEYYKGSYCSCIVKKLRNDIYYSMAGLEHHIEFDD